MILAKKCCWSAILILILGITAQAQSVKVPPKLEATANRLSTLNVEWDGDDIKWTYDDKNLAVFREYDPDSKKIVLKVLPYVNNAILPIKFIVCKDKKLSDFVTTEVVVGKAPPVPPPPGPDPPPDPIDDPLTKAYNTALSKETASDKLESVKKLVAVYQEISDNAEKSEVKTWGNVFSMFNQYRDKVSVRTSIMEVQKVSQELMKSRFSDDEDKTLSVDDKKLIKDTFKRMAESLKPLAPVSTKGRTNG